MSETIQTSANINTFNRCLICQAEVSKRSFSSLKLCQKFITLASRYYNIHFKDNSVNLSKTLELNQLKSESDCVQLGSCDNCSQKMNSFCKIYEEVSLLQIHLDASARKIVQLMKDIQLTKLSNNNQPQNNVTSDSGKFTYFRNRFCSKVKRNLPHLKLGRLEIDNNQPTVENDPLFILIENENSGNEMDTVEANINRSSALPPPPPFTQPRTELTHHSKFDNIRRHRKKKLSRANNNLSYYQKHRERPSSLGNPVQHEDCVQSTSKEVSSGCQDLAADSSAAANNVEMLKSLPQGSLLIVQRAPEPERHHKCRFCHKTFITPQNKASHENVHLQRYKCRFCGKSFNFKHRLVIHERIHTGIKPFKCSVCAETFREKRACKNHIWSVHKGNGEVIEEDPNQSQDNSLVLKAKTEPNVTQAKATRNSQDAEKRFKCPICLKGFAQRQLLNNHKKIHTKPFNCDICGARFALKSYLEKHKRTHTGERPYLCPVCFQTFTRHQSCKDHQRNIHKIANGVVINTKTYGVKIVPENVVSLPKGNQNVTSGNQSVNEVQRIANIQDTNGDSEDFILPDTQQEFEMNFKEGDVTSVDTKPMDPLGYV